MPRIQPASKLPSGRLATQTACRCWTVQSGALPLTSPPLLQPLPPRTAEGGGGHGVLPKGGWPRPRLFCWWGPASLLLRRRPTTAATAVGAAAAAAAHLLILLLLLRGGMRGLHWLLWARAGGALSRCNAGCDVQVRYTTLRADHPAVGKVAARDLQQQPLDAAVHGFGIPAYSSSTQVRSAPERLLFDGDERGSRSHAPEPQRQHAPVLHVCHVCHSMGVCWQA